MDPIVGAGGWAYFTGPTGSHLRDYARAFPFVEVNSTFYETPTAAAAGRWRRTVPGDFAFSMKAPMSVSHRARLRPGRTLKREVAAAARVANVLGASTFVVETPPSLALGAREIEGLGVVQEALGGAAPQTRLALEARAYRGGPLPGLLRRRMAQLGIQDVVDLSTASPRVDSGAVYARLFGPGEGNRWEFTDDELRAIADRADDAGAERVSFAFHGVRMYKDAGRFLEFRRSGTFPRPTRGEGLASLDEVLRDGGSSFPATQAQLLATQGWRVVDIGGRSVHASSLLRLLPVNRAFGSLAEVLAALAPRMHLAEGGEARDGTDGARRRI